MGTNKPVSKTIYECPVCSAEFRDYDEANRHVNIPKLILPEGLVAKVNNVEFFGLRKDKGVSCYVVGGFNPHGFDGNHAAYHKGVFVAKDSQGLFSKGLYANEILRSYRKGRFEIPSEEEFKHILETHPSLEFSLRGKIGLTWLHRTTPTFERMLSEEGK